MYTREQLKQLKKEFWEGFGVYCDQLDELVFRKKKWILYDTKVRGLELKFDATREGAFVIMEVNQRSESERLAMYEKLEKYKVIFEEYIQDPLVWDFAFVRESGQEVCRIYCQKSGIDIHRRSQWNDFYSFMASRMLQMEQVFWDLKEIITA